MQRFFKLDIMITSKELRLGNYILGFYEDEDGLEENEDVLFETVCQVTSLDYSGFLDFSIYVESEHKNTEVYEKFEGIKLTKDWLNKLGFFIVETNGTFEATLQNFRYSVQIVKEYDGFLFCDGEKVLTNFNYVHELQNLVFILGHRELTVT